MARAYVTAVLEEAIVRDRKKAGNKKVDGGKEITKLKKAGRYVLEVY
jgi:sulfite reductase (NADPH) flavoprotein alpha-component